jgi:hypothetical protein
MFTVLIILAVIALIVTILSVLTPPKAPLWVAVLILCLIELIRTVPIGK